MLQRIRVEILLIYKVYYSYLRCYPNDQKISNRHGLQSSYIALLDTDGVSTFRRYAPAQKLPKVLA